MPHPFASFAKGWEYPIWLMPHSIAFFAIEWDYPPSYSRATKKAALSSGLGYLRVITHSGPDSPPYSQSSNTN